MKAHSGGWCWLVLVISWGLSWESRPEYLHVASPLSFGFLTVRWLASCARESHPVFYHLASWVHICDVSLVEVTMKSYPIPKRGEIRLHFLIGEYQGSRRAGGTGNTIEAVLGKCGVPHGSGSEDALRSWT